MLHMQRVHNGELGERRLRYSASLMRSIKESEAKNKNRNNDNYDNFRQWGDEAIDLRRREEKKNFKVVSDETATRISQLREKAGAILKKKVALSVLTERGPKDRATDFKRDVLAVTDRVWSRKRLILLGISAVVGLFIVVVGSMMIVDGHVIGVAINGRTLGNVKDESALRNIVNDVRADLSEDNLNTDIIIDENQIALADGNVALSDQKTNSLTSEDLKAFLVESGAVKANAYTISVDGEPRAVVPTEQDVTEVMNAVVGEFTENAANVEYKMLDEVRIEHNEISLDALQTTTEAVNVLLSEEEAAQTYEVKAGDTVWGITTSLDISIDEIKEANPGVQLDKIHPGDQLKLNAADPLLRIQTRELTTTTVAIRYKVIEEKTSSLYQGERKVKTAGIEGKMIVTNEAIKVNGELVSKGQVESQVISSPSSEVVLVGTKQRADWYNAPGGGTLGRPMSSLNLSSPFGGARNHKGADLANPVGTSVYAAAGGTVSFSGYSGNYGNLIIINHGNGLSTYYAHLSTMSVSSGQSVSRGQGIGKVGMTGRTTGPHLHFEVRVNGAPRNPMGYI